MADLLIGWAEADITPDRTVELHGQYYQRVSAGIHSRLGLTALVLAQGKEQAVWISADLTSFDRGLLGEIREAVRATVPDLDGSRILMNATHTHCAPAVKAWKNWWTPDPAAMQVEDYRRFVVGRAAEAIATAWVARAAGGAAAVREQAVVGHCRRAVYANGTAEMYGDTRRPDFIGMEGNEDSTLNLLFFFDGRGRPTGAIVNASCPAQVMEATYQVSSDYMGEARRLLKETFGPAFGVLCQIGPAGCQSPRDLARTRDAAYWSAAGAARLGRRVAEAAVRASEPAADVQRTGLSLRHTVRDLPLPRRRVLYPDFVRARDELAALEKTMASVEAFRSFCAEMKRNEAIPNRPGPYDSKLHPFVLMRNAEAVLKRYEDQRAEPDRAIELHAIRLGDAALATSPFELFLDYGLRIQARSPAAHTVLTQLCCGSEGYLPTARAEALGGYGALVINGQVGSDGGALLVDETLADIRRLFA